MKLRPSITSCSAWSIRHNFTTSCNGPCANVRGELLVLPAIASITVLAAKLPLLRSRVGSSQLSTSTLLQSMLQPLVHDSQGPIRRAAYRRSTSTTTLRAGTIVAPAGACPLIAAIHAGRSGWSSRLPAPAELWTSRMVLPGTRLGCCCCCCTNKHSRSKQSWTSWALTGDASVEHAWRHPKTAVSTPGIECRRVNWRTVGPVQRVRLRAGVERHDDAPPALVTHAARSALRFRRHISAEQLHDDDARVLQRHQFDRSNAQCQSVSRVWSPDTCWCHPYSKLLIVFQAYARPPLRKYPVCVPVSMPIWGAWT